VTEPSFQIERLEAHDRSTFGCGVDALDRYFRQQVGQDVRRRIATCFVLTDLGGGRVAGFYTLSACDIEFADLPEERRRGLPRYPTVPAVRLGRLAVDTSFRGRGLGAALLFDAILRAARSDIAAHFLLVDATNDAAASFYRHYGFEPDPVDGRRHVASLDYLVHALRRP
jgi:ribosomal protein S18 acetylase RimI-like enzyme